MHNRLPELISQEELDAGTALDDMYQHDHRFTVDDLEFSNHGRSEMFQSGWWLIPAAMLSFGLAGLLAWVWFF